MINPSTPYQEITQAVVNYHNGMVELQNRLRNHGNWFTNLFLSRAVKKQRSIVVNTYFSEILYLIGIALVASEDEIVSECLAVFVHSKASPPNYYTIVADPALPSGIKKAISELNLTFITAVRKYSIS